MKTDKGFTLVELMIVLGLIGIIAAIAIPQMIRNRMSGNEAAAIAAMRTITGAETQFQTSAFADADADAVGDYGPLNGAVSLANPSAGTAPYVDEILATGVKSGYVFLVTVDNVGEGDEAYTCTARPTAFGRTGVRSFFVNETGILRYETANVAPTVDSAPLT